MKALPVALAAHIATRCTTLAVGLKITREDDEVFAFTSHDVNDTIDGVTYTSEPGLDVTSIQIQADAAVGNLELKTLHDGTVFSTADILGGRWRNAAFIIFRYNWADLTQGIDTLLVGTLGEVTINVDTVTAEMRDLRQYLQNSVGSASSKTCRYRLGSTDKNNGGLCMKDVSAAPFTMPLTVTAVASKLVFTASARTEVADFFAEGRIQWTTGPNAGITSRIRSFSGGVFTLALPMVLPIAIGNQGIVTAGCRLRLEEDCRDKFDNVINFGGEPHRLGLNNITSPAEPNVAASSYQEAFEELL